MAKRAVRVEAPSWVAIQLASRAEIPRTARTAGGRGGQSQPPAKGSRRKLGDVLTLLVVHWQKRGFSNGCFRIRKPPTLTVIIGNGDMLLKNWLLIHRGHGEEPELAPIYDVLWPVPHIAADTMALSLGGERSFKSKSLNASTSIGGSSRNGP